MTTNERGAFPINDFCMWAGIGKTLVYDLINRGELATIKIGGRTLIAVDDAKALIEKNRHVAGQPPRTSTSERAA